MRMENGDGMAVSEFCYPLFQGYDWWHMYSTKGVQMQIGGSDQYGNICAGMDAVDHMRKYRNEPGQTSNDVLNSPFGLTTPLLTTASGEKFGKSAGNAIWLDDTMLSSFDLYQVRSSKSAAHLLAANDSILVFSTYCRRRRGALLEAFYVHSAGSY